MRHTDMRHSELMKYVVHAPSRVPIATPNPSPHLPQHSKTKIFWSLNMSFKQIQMLTVKILVCTSAVEPIPRWQVLYKILWKPQRYE